MEKKASARLVGAQGIQVNEYVLKNSSILFKWIWLLFKRSSGMNSALTLRRVLLTMKEREKKNEKRNKHRRVKEKHPKGK